MPAPSAPVLVGDIGGTNTRFALAHVDRDGSVELRDEWSWRTDETRSLAAGVARYRESVAVPVRGSCVAVAGPVLGPTAALTNTPWQGAVQDLPGAGRLVNDLQAAAAGVCALDPDDVAMLRQRERDPVAPLVVLGLGTGLGEAIRVGDRILPGEGGHKTFGPADAQQCDFATFLAARLGRPPSWEDALSGRGLGAAYAFLAGEAAVPGDADDHARHVTRNPDATWCREAALLYAECCAVEARNLGLQVIARGGVWLCGGMPGRLPRDVWAQAFDTHFVLDGPMSGLADTLPVFIVEHPALNLVGAATLCP